MSLYRKLRPIDYYKIMIIRSNGNDNVNENIVVKALLRVSDLHDSLYLSLRSFIKRINVAYNALALTRLS